MYFDLKSTKEQIQIINCYIVFYAFLILIRLFFQKFTNIFKD